MKLAILVFATFITGLITLSSPVSNIKGTWVMQSQNSSCSNNVLRIKMNEGIWVAKIDIPEQQVYDREVFDISAKKDSVFITVFKNGPTIKAALVNETTIAGELVSDGKADAVKLVRN
jgi:hypothetical protein